MMDLLNAWCSIAGGMDLPPWLMVLPLLGFLDAFSNRSQRTTNTTSLYENAFNTSSSEISSVDGSTTITVGEPGGGGQTSSIVVIAFAAVMVLSGLYLITRRQ